MYGGYPYGGYPYGGYPLAAPAFRNPFLPYRFPRPYLGLPRLGLGMPFPPLWPGAGVGGMDPSTQVDLSKGVMYGGNAAFKDAKSARAAKIFGNYVMRNGIPPWAVAHDLRTKDPIATDEAQYASNPLAYDAPGVDDGSQPYAPWNAGLQGGLLGGLPPAYPFYW